MRFVPTPLVDAKVIELDPRRDKRGLFVRCWCQKAFQEAGIAFDAVQANLSVSTRKGTIRGLHFQRAPFAEPKVVRCVKGAVQEVIIDLRPLSATYRQHFTVVLNEPGLSMMYVPAGFAQGIQTLADDTIVEYLMGEYYQPDVYDGIRHDDPAFAIPWALPASEISEQDLAWTDWSLRDLARPPATLRDRSMPKRDAVGPAGRMRPRVGYEGFVPPSERPSGSAGARVEMKLVFNSAGSPFARKVRIVLAELGLAAEEDIRPGLRPVEELKQINPNLSLPVLIDGDVTLFESNLIIDYLLDRYAGGADRTGDPPLAPALVRAERRWEDAKILATIETFADTVVNVRHFSGEGATAETSRYMARQEARIGSCLDWLEERITPDGFWPGYFSAMDIALVCPLAYGETRGVVQWRSGRARIEAMFERSRLRPSVAATAEA